MTDRKVDQEKGTIEVALRYNDYDFDSRVVVTAKGKAVEIAVWLDKPVPEKLAGDAGFNLEFLPSRYWLKTFTMDGRLNRFPRYATSQTITRPNSEKPRQFKGFCRWRQVIRLSWQPMTLSAWYVSAVTQS